MELAVRPWLLRSPPSPSNVRRGNEQCAKVLTKLGLPKRVEAKLCWYVMAWFMAWQLMFMIYLLIMCFVSKKHIEIIYKQIINESLKHLEEFLGQSFWFKTKRLISRASLSHKVTNVCRMMYVSCVFSFCVLPWPPIPSFWFFANLFERCLVCLKYFEIISMHFIHFLFLYPFFIVVPRWLAVRCITFLNISSEFACHSLSEI